MNHYPISPTPQATGYMEIDPDTGGLIIPLRSGTYPGRFTLMDPEDYHLVRDFAWYARRTGRPDARRSIYVHGRRNGSKEYAYMHRLILGITDPRVKVDHINRDPLDNRRANLRVATQAENTFNRGPMRNAASRFKGVTWYPKNQKWVARIRIDGEQRYLGIYGSEEDAARAYDAAAFKAFGEFAYLNFPEEVR